MKIDSTDRRILDEIQRDASIALETLGERVGLSRNACWRRVKTLEAEGVILGRVALLNSEALGVPLTVYIRVTAPRHDPNWAEAFRREACEIPEIVGVYRMAGDVDYLVRAQVSDVAGYDVLYKQLVSRLDIGELSASFVMEKVKETTALPV